MSLGNGNPKEGDKGSNFQFELMMLKSLEAISNKLSTTGALSKAPASDVTLATLTGTLSQTIIKTLTLQPNTLQIGNYWTQGGRDFGYTEAAVNYAGAGNTTVTIYINNAPNLTGAVQLNGGLTAGGASNNQLLQIGIVPTGGPTNTTARIVSNTTIQYLTATALPGSYTTATIPDITKTVYVMIVATLNDVGTTVTIGPTYINPLKKL